VKTQYILRDLRPEVIHLEMACSRCARSGKLSIARLMRDHGGDATIRDAVVGVNADCPKLQETSIMGRCDVFFPGLAGMLR
jgi:hypothetical protein